MLKNRKFLINCAVSLVSILALSLVALFDTTNGYRLTRGDYEPYSIQFDTNKNKIGVGSFSPSTTYSGSGVAATELGNQVAFDYVDLYNPTNFWQTIKAGGSITNTQPINGMENLTLTKNSSSANFKVYWSNTTTFSEDRMTSFDTSSELTVYTNFGGYLPKYIKILAIANSAITSGRIEFSCSNNYPSLSLSTNSNVLGSVTGAGIYAAGQEVTITATPVEGSYFVGWFDGENLISTSASYVFNMPFIDTHYLAHFAVNSYALTLTSNDINKGTVAGSGSYAYGSEVTAIATEIAGNEFIGWYQSATLKSTNLSYTFTMPHNALSLEARFVTKYNVEVVIINDTFGSVSGDGMHGYTTNVTLNATPNEGYWFLGWYDDNFNLISRLPLYDFFMPENNVTYYAEFSDSLTRGSFYSFGKYPQAKVTDSSLVSSLTTAAGTLPTAANSQSWTDYGYYIRYSVSSYMWYIDLVNDGDEYRGVYFTSYRPYETSEISSTGKSSQDDNGYYTSNVYWFKYEPITWRVLDVQSGKALLMANLILDSQDYYYSTANRTINSQTVYANNYEHSHIRTWLNDTFYNTAFGNSQKEKIQTTTVDNSVASTGSRSNQYAGANTNDNIFLLSYVEATNTTYNLNTNASRQLQGSDYAKSQGLYVYTSNGNSNWWLRSPHINSSYARGVRSDGSFYDYSDYILSTNYGVVPALWISV